MKIFVTSNLQLGRPAAIKQYKRSYTDVDQMTDDLILKWNETVKAEDTVFYLGNFAHDPKTAQDALQRLNGNIKLNDDVKINKVYEAIQATTETQTKMREIIKLIIG